MQKAGGCSLWSLSWAAQDFESWALEFIISVSPGRDLEPQSSSWTPMLTSQPAGVGALAKEQGLSLTS